MDVSFRAPNIALFVVAGCLAMIGVLSALPIALPIPGLNANNAAWYIFLGWFLLSAGTVLPQRSAVPAQE
jgi:zinc transporter ZupT